jgi:hypothetical protein
LKTGQSKDRSRRHCFTYRPIHKTHKRARVEDHSERVCAMRLQRGRLTYLFVRPDTATRSRPVRTHEILFTPWQTWQRPTLPCLKTKYHRRRGVSRPSSEWDRVQPPRHNHQVGEGVSLNFAQLVFLILGASDALLSHPRQCLRSSWGTVPYRASRRERSKTAGTSAAPPEPRRAYSARHAA